MNISKKQRIRNNTLEVEWFLRYYCYSSIQEIETLADALVEKGNLKNYWLQKRQDKQKVEERDMLIEKIIQKVGKYISDRKANNGSI
jgi:hypothetical protein